MGARENTGASQTCDPPPSARRSRSAPKPRPLRPATSLPGEGRAPPLPMGANRRPAARRLSPPPQGNLRPEKSLY